LKEDNKLKRFNEGDTVYFIASSIFVRKAKVVRNTGGFCTIIFDGNHQHGTLLPYKKSNIMFV
jgi:hypothetical protein